jgi:hypothetical protein
VSVCTTSSRHSSSSYSYPQFATVVNSICLDVPSATGGEFVRLLEAAVHAPLPHHPHSRSHPRPPVNTLHYDWAVRSHFTLPPRL